MALTWLLCMDIAHASFSGSCLLVTTAPPRACTVHLSSPTVTSCPDMKCTVGYPEVVKGWRTIRQGVGGRGYPEVVKGWRYH